MPVSLPLVPKKPTEADIERVILKGGAAPKEDLPEETPRHINIRLTEGILRRIDALRSRRPRRVGSPKMGISLRDWIAEAVLKQLEEEEKP
jgi:hypothetical protein